jgi:hypothetical protein
MTFPAHLIVHDFVALKYLKNNINLKLIIIIIIVSVLARGPCVHTLCILPDATLVLRVVKLIYRRTNPDYTLGETLQSVHKFGFQTANGEYSHYTCMIKADK